MQSTEPTEGLHGEHDEPLHDHLERDPADDDERRPVEDTAQYERAVEEGTVVPPIGDDPGAGDDAPEFREPLQ